MAATCSLLSFDPGPLRSGAIGASRAAAPAPDPLPAPPGPPAGPAPAGSLPALRGRSPAASVAARVRPGPLILPRPRARPALHSAAAAPFRRRPPDESLLDRPELL